MARHLRVYLQSLLLSAAQIAIFTAAARCELLATIEGNNAFQPSGRYLYEYTVINDPASTLAINYVFLSFEGNVQLTNVNGPAGWQGQYASDVGGPLVDWFPVSDAFRIAPGEQAIFSFESPFSAAIDGSFYFIASFADLGDFDPEGSAFGITMGPLAPPPQLGDLNGDSAVNNLDIAPFALALTDAAAYAEQYPFVEPIEVGDVNVDGEFNNLDIAPFAELLTGGGTSVPEPGTLGLVCLGGGILVVHRLVRRRGAAPRGRAPHSGKLRGMKSSR